MRVIVDPEDDIQYMSFYLLGLIQLFGEKNVVFRHQAFNELSYSDRNTRTMRFIVTHGMIEKRFVIDTNDSFKINERLYDWSDVYGSVNANFSKTPENLQKKLVSLCPSFAIQYIRPHQALFPAIMGMVTTHRDKRKYLGCWKRMLQRPKLQYYYPQNSRENYIFHLSTLWRSDEWNRNDEGVNYRRAMFIRTCKSMGSELFFDGGLVTSRSDKSTALFSDCLSERLPTHECLKRTIASTIVFNTPAYWDCHGWKLGEYMALGKAILSTPLSNDLPAPLINGQHIHYVDVTSPSELQSAIRLLLKEKTYRRELEKNIHQYWCSYGTPALSLRLMGITK